jgi:hypothetical protein
MKDLLVQSGLGDIRQVALQPDPGTKGPALFVSTAIKAH